jgi:Ohr subfamily peroxiredoxin
MKTLFTAKATTIAGRNGHTETEDKSISLDLAMPGSGKKGANPEQLFAMGYSACFGSAIDAVAKKQQVKVDEIKVQADVSLNTDDSGGYFIGAVLNVSLKGVDAATAKKLVEAAHQICPYSKATRGNIEVQLKVNNEPLKQAA